MGIALPQVVTSDRASGAQVIDGSLKFDGPQYLIRTSGSSGNRKTWNWSAWVKKSTIANNQQILFSAIGDASDRYLSLDFRDDNVRLVSWNGSSRVFELKTSRVLRDPSSWYHIVFSVDTTQSTSSDTIKIYINGVKETVFTTASYPSQNTDTYVNAAVSHQIGENASSYTAPNFDAFMSQCYFIDGQALGPGYFGFTDPLTNTWRPRKFRAEGTTVNDGTVWSSLASVSSGSFQGSYPATNAFNGTLTSSDRANGDTNGSSIDLDFSGKNIIVKNDIAIWSGKSSMRYSINGGEYVSYSDATEKWKTIPFSGRLTSLKIKHGSDSEQPGFSGLAVDGVTMLDSTTTNLDFGTNGFYLPMDGNSPIGKDLSNPNPINNEIIWSSGIAGTQDTSSGGGAVAAFDGTTGSSDSNGSYPAAGQTLTWTPANSSLGTTLSYSSTIRVYVKVDTNGDDGGLIVIGANGSQTIDAGGSGQKYVDISAATSPITSIAWSRASSGGQGVGLQQVEVDGIVLVDGLYGNSWTPVNFGGSVALDNPQVSGARPILNTDGGGNVARPGVFGSEENQFVTVTVASKTGGGNAYFFGGVERDSLASLRGTTVTFDTTDSTNNSHPFKLSSTNADSSGGTEYTDGVAYYINGSVTTGSDYVTNYSSGAASGFRGIKWTVPHNVSTTYYYCTVHTGMGEGGRLTSTTDETKADPYAWKNTLALPLVGSANDVSNSVNSGSTTKAVTTNGNPVASSAQSNFYNGSFEFDSDDYLSLADSNDFNLVSSGTGDFTIEFYVYLPNISARYVLSSGTDSTRLYINSSTRLHLNNPSDSFLMESSTAAAAIKANKWTHIAFCKSSSTGYIFVDGVQYSFHSGPALGGSLDFNDLRIGRSSTSLSAHIQDVRIYKGAAKYTSDFVVPATSPDILPDTPSGVSGGSKLTKITDGAVYFDGTGDYCSTVSSSDFTMGTGDFTVECFITKDDSSHRGIWQISSTSGGLQSSNYTQTLALGYQVNRWQLYAGGSQVNGTSPPNNGSVMPKKWYHLAVVRNSGTTKLYVDGREEISTSDTYNYTGTYMAFGGYYNTSYLHYGNISNLRVIKGTALYTSNFTPPTRELTNVTNTKLLCCQSNTSAIAAAVTPGTITANGDAAATNFNPFNTDINTVRGQETGYPTWNPLNNNGGTLSNGNLSLTSSGAANVSATLQIPTTGKWYWEYFLDGLTSGGVIGIADGSAMNGTALGDWTKIYGYSPNGNKYENASASSYGPTLATGDLVGVKYDADTRQLEFLKNNVSQGVAYTVSSDYDYYPSIHGNIIEVTANFGQKPFKYAPPAGFQPLNAANVKPETVLTRPDQYVGIITATGTAGDRHFKTPGGFGPDLVWSKERNASTNNALFDSVRGATKRLVSNSTQVEDTQATQLKSFTYDGFIYGSDIPNNTGDTGVYWCWKAGGNKNTFNIDDVGYASAAAAGLTAGDTTPTGASVGTKQGFSIIKYTGPNDTNNHEVPHGLSQAPDFIITKNLDATYNWDIYHSSLADDAYLIFTNATTRAQGFNGRPTSTVFKTEHDYSTNENQDYIAYCWHNVTGLQKFGIYEGNNNSDGPFVELGFRPSIIWMKNIDASGNWIIYDNERDKFNGATKILLADTNGGGNANDAFVGSYPTDFLSNGFKIRNTTGEINNSNTYIYCAWAEAPTFNLYGGQSNAR